MKSFQIFFQIFPSLKIERERTLSKKQCPPAARERFGFVDIRNMTMTPHDFNIKPNISFKTSFSFNI